ncbi:MAG: hypothetical protein HY718_00275 [Planctomycetes bacterium]|nr:hypothetical protein [Planctomycetota bacterium]
MPTTQQVQEIVDKVRTRLADAEREGVHLKVAGERLEDDWLYIVVVPTRPGVRASEHARLMSQIERELRQQGDDNVLLVPALDD